MSNNSLAPLGVFGSLFTDLLKDEVITDVLGDVGIKMALVTEQVVMSDDEDNVYFKAVVPGFNKDELDVSVLNNSVIISGTRKETSEKGDLFSSGQASFKYTYAIPSDVRVKDISSELKSGILVVTFPKLAETARSLNSRSIPIKQLEKSEENE